VAKVLETDMDNEKKGWKSFESELNTLIKLDNPNIIRIYDFFNENNKFFLILEYCPNGSLEQEIAKNGKLSITKMRNLTSQLFSAISYSHGCNIAHRDIKPQNVLIDQFGRYKLADFGIAQVFDSQDSLCIILVVL